MKNLEYPCRSIITGMDISLLTTTSDIEQLRANLASGKPERHGQKSPVAAEGHRISGVLG